MKTQKNIKTIQNIKHHHKSLSNLDAVSGQKQKNHNQLTIKKSRISNIIFKYELSRQQKQKILQKIKNFYQLKEWRFNFKQDIKKNDPTILFKASETLLIEGLTFHFCKNQKLIKSLKCINFPRLRCLCLPGNNIKSWQFLNTIDLESIQVIDLRQNFPSSSKSLIKANFNKIDNLTLPSILVDSSQELLRRSKFTQSFRRMFIEFVKNANIFPFLCSIMFKEKKWSENESRITIVGSSISSRSEKLHKKLVSRRSNLTLLENFPMSLYQPLK